MLKSFFNANKTHSFVVVFLLLMVAGCVTNIILFDTVGREADSINHYLYSKYAFEHPANFFDHWAKPLFVVLTAPFAQFGVNGLQFFNVLVFSLSGYFAFRVGQKLGFKWALFVPVIMFCFPLVIADVFGGLTEYLFGLILIIAVDLVLRSKLIAAVILVSFLPMVRSEGLVMLCVMAVFLMVTGNWKKVPLLLVGQIVFNLIGAVHYGDLLWTFTKIPYASLGSVYGNGDVWHFFNKFPSVFGVPGTIILYISVLFQVIGIGLKSLYPKMITKEAAFLYLVLGGFVAFFIAHTIFWTFGIFRSMGLPRVFYAVSPLVALICISGFGKLEDFTPPQFKGLSRGLVLSCLIYVVVFPFTPNVYALKWSKHFEKSKSQKLVDEEVFHLKTTYPGALIVSDNPYVQYKLDLDPFDPEKSLALKDYDLSVPPNQTMIVIWDSWFNNLECKFDPEILEKNMGLANRVTFLTDSNDSSSVAYIAYILKPIQKQ